ncbi:hypothetical protein [Methylotuvimicrobium sp. KM1]|uniref:hypothetical protein n=1 Tax=Methylotuvimicrobium sp. KM1 TaxID=3377707 RepID=UPI0038508569
MQGKKMLLHFLHSLHPCNSAIAEEQKSALPPTPVNRAAEPCFNHRLDIDQGKLFRDPFQAGSEFLSDFNY